MKPIAARQVGTHHSPPALDGNLASQRKEERVGRLGEETRRVVHAAGGRNVCIIEFRVGWRKRKGGNSLEGNDGDGDGDRVEEERHLVLREGAVEAMVQLDRSVYLRCTSEPVSLAVGRGSKEGEGAYTTNDECDGANRHAPDETLHLGARRRYALPGSKQPLERVQDVEDHDGKLERDSDQHYPKSSNQNFGPLLLPPAMKKESAYFEPKFWWSAVVAAARFHLRRLGGGGTRRRLLQRCS